MSFSKAKFAALLASVKSKTSDPVTHAGVDKITAAMEVAKVTRVDLSNLGLKTSAQLKTVAAEEMIEDIVVSLAEVKTPEPVPEPVEEGSPKLRNVGVTRDIQLNEKQQMFYDTVLSGKSCVLIGAAGTGKTTSVRKISQGMIDSGNYSTIHISTKSLLAQTPGILVLSFTRKAVANIRRAVIDELKKNTLTIHKVLEFEPTFYEVFDQKSQSYKNSMRFEPKRHKTNPLPSSIRAVIFEESSMIALELHALLEEAMPHKPQMIYLGDIQQLPPVFGQAILGFKMVELPIIELTEVYRQALDSPIISLAWKILAGNPLEFKPDTVMTKGKNGKSRLSVPSLDALSYENAGSSVKFQPWQKKLDPEVALIYIDRQIQTWIEAGYYNPETDITLCPFNKSFGTIELNKNIANYLGFKRKALVFVVLAGFETKYLAVGDRMLYDKEDAFITKILPNPQYLGKKPPPPSIFLDRNGFIRKDVSDAEQKTEENNAALLDFALTDDDLEALMSSISIGTEEDRVNQASHIVHLRYAHTMEEGETVEDLTDATGDVILTSSGELNNLLGGYVITVHKFQGCEAEKVFCLFHGSHAKMMQRELIYTAVTRARKHLHIICEPDSFYKAVQSQAIKGNTIAEKALIFKGRMATADRQKAMREQQEASFNSEEG